LVGGGQNQTFQVPGSPTAPPRGNFLAVMTPIDPTTPAAGGDFVVVTTPSTTSRSTNRAKDRPGGQRG
jgi:hypothetical protein